LLRIRDEYNKLNKNNQIHSNDPKVIWKFFKKLYENICNNEVCWINKFNISPSLKKEINELFSPSTMEKWKKNDEKNNKEDENVWLSNIDIENVLKQYEKVYPCFLFLGTTPIDYFYKSTPKNQNSKCVCDRMCKFNLKDEINRGYNKIGIVLNTDNHTGPGIHWVSLFINIKKEFIFYFDSGGEKIPELIMGFVNRVISQGKNMKPTPINFKFSQNYPNQHQYSNSQCGMYSLYFIIELLLDKKTPNYFKTKKIKDKEMDNYRYKYFNNIHNTS